MRDRHRQVLTGWQLFCLLVSSIVGTGVYSLARDVAEPAGAGGILSILLVGILMVISLLSLHLLASRFPGQTLNEYSGQILGPLLAKVYLLVYSFMSLGIAVSIPRAHFPVVSAWALGQTPQLVYILPFVL
ncbi:MAG TPA: GerAB/ArcD/ProY family transporter, partial [Firmicutes bacterium]|nr:GerAB/ArcD/ProY family transporter [Bacillota bacterium]